MSNAPWSAPPGVDPGLEIVEVTTRTWSLFEELLGPGGVQGGCWCAYFRMGSRDFDATSPAYHRTLVRSAVEAGKPFGLVAVRDGAPVGWVAVSPRLDNVRLERSRVARTDAADLAAVWSVVCFYARRGARGQRLTASLVQAATAYARHRGARLLEAYPIDAAVQRYQPGELYHGPLQAFLDAGFELVERRGVRRALVRIRL